MKRYRLYRDRPSCTCTHVGENPDGPWVKFVDAEYIIAQQAATIGELKREVWKLTMELIDATAKKK